MYTEFHAYMDRTYLSRERFVHWSAAFQPQIYTNMETNNFIESWHNQLKTTYMGRKRNRRVDRLLYILVNDVEPDYINNICRISLNVGRMGPEERRRRRRELNAESINEAVLAIMITEPEGDGNTYTVQSFTDEMFLYEIEVINREMITCSCKDFEWNKIACKHMYLLRRLHKDIAVYKVLVNLAMPPINREPQEPLHEKETSFDTSSTPSTEIRVLNLITDLEAVLNSYKHNARHFTEQQIEQLTKSATDISNIFPNNLGSNTNFTTQRR